MLSSQVVVNYFPDEDEFGPGHDVLPMLAGNASGYIMDNYLFDIAEHAKLKQTANGMKNAKIRFEQC
jgi:hypothetical protein